MSRDTIDYIFAIVVIIVAIIVSWMFVNSDKMSDCMEKYKSYDYCKMRIMTGKQ